MKKLNSIYDLTWAPRTVIEAGAGTGKTYTIVGLYVRLIIEKELSVDRILVMTFTKKATSELRGRILDRLRNCRRVLRGHDHRNDPFLKELTERVTDEEIAPVLERINAAIRDFDESRIFTIHGFCQRLLSEEPILTGMPFDMDVVATDDLLLRAAEDFWRNFIDQHSRSAEGRYIINQLRDIAETPEDLVEKKLGDLFSIHQPKPEGSGLENAEGRAKNLLELKKEMSAVWEESSELLRQQIDDSGLSGYTGRNLNSRFRKMSEFLSDVHASLIPDQIQTKWFHPDYLFDEDNLTQKPTSATPPNHRFYDLCARYVDEADGIEFIQNEVVLRAWREIRKRRAELASESSALTFDDLLLKVKDSLENEETGPELAQILREQYPYALVDEFQDTDSVQYSILSSVYKPENKNSGLLMIGDPKQAIYGFRGADIYTYFRAKEDHKPDLYSLRKNFRSSSTLVTGINRLFEADGKSRFLDERISFFPSESGNSEAVDHYLKDGSYPVSLSISMTSGIFSSKGDAKDSVFRELVRQIVDLLNGEETEIRDNETGTMREIEARDIAILVNGRDEGSVISRMLKKAGVDTVISSRDSVFDTFEAKRLLLLMEALLDPHDQSRLNGALLSGLFGTDLAEILRIQQDEELLEEFMPEMLDLMEVWSRKGFLPLFRKVLYRDGRLDQLAGLSNSERILTNLNQLAEIISIAEKESNLEPHALVSWFRREMGRSAEDEERTLLLESDRNLVTISTIHSSKGLEYPIVFCPTLWNGRDQKPKKIFNYHLEESEELVVNIDFSGSEESQVAAEKALWEQLQEEVRKAYVALTRAKYDCRIFWATHNQSHLSGLGAALTDRSLLQSNLSGKLKEGEDLDDSYYQHCFEQLAESSPEEIAFRMISGDDENREVKLILPETVLPAAVPYNGPLQPEVNRRIFSFSSLASHKSDPSEPDHDEISEQFADQFDPEADHSLGIKSIFSFPRGATAGTAIHKLFEDERVDFTTMATDDLSAVVADILEEYGFDTEWSSTLQQMMKDVALAALPDFAMKDIPKADRLREMEFHFPVSEPDYDKLQQIIGGGSPRGAGSNMGRHYLTGFIDLVVRHNGVYYILDYKSNHLGDTPESYQREHLKRSVEDAGYNLQYHLYTVALTGMLSRRLPDFDYDKHFGGVAYLYVRGMKAGSDNGIWFDRPEQITISKLQSILKR
ncbi:MAG: exodeoxyribonuclease V subunit beta [Balneolaceae bacterium]|nr:exodeoxyribonuclease V subunit beta [Balneolaceae bacterium]